MHEVKAPPRCAGELHHVDRDFGAQHALVLQWYLSYAPGIMIPSPSRERGIVVLINASIPLMLDQEIPVVQGGAAYLNDIERCLAPAGTRARPGIITTSVVGQ